MLNCALLLATVGTSGGNLLVAPIECDFVTWSRVIARENGSKTVIVNTGTTSLPEWLQISKVEATVAKAVVYGQVERSTPGLSRLYREVDGTLKWRLMTGQHPGNNTITVNFGFEGHSEAAVVVGGPDVTAKAKSREDNGKAATKQLFLNVIGSETDNKDKNTVAQRIYSPTWTQVTGGYEATIMLDFKSLYTQAVVQATGTEGDVAEPNPFEEVIATPPSSAYAKAWFEVCSTPRFTPTLTQAYSVDDGRIRIYGSAIGSKYDLARLELFTDAGVVLGMIHTWIEDDDSFFLDTPMPQQAGTYKIYVTPRGALRKRVDFAFDGSSPVQVSPSFLWGDIDGNNQITQFDIDIINRFLNVDTDDQEWGGIDDPVFHDFSGEMCDLDGNSVVNSVDVAIAFANLGLNGDQ